MNTKSKSIMATIYTFLYGEKMQVLSIIYQNSRISDGPHNPVARYGWSKL